MAADETILEEEQEALSDDLQAELEDDMFFGEEDQPGEELTDSEDFLSEEELTDTGTDELLEDDIAGDADLEDVLGEADEASSEESLTEDTLEMEEGDLEEALKEELSSEADLETEDLAEIKDDELPPLEEGDLEHDDLFLVAVGVRTLQQVGEQRDDGDHDHVADDDEQRRHEPLPQEVAEAGRGACAERKRKEKLLREGSCYVSHAPQGEG